MANFNTLKTSIAAVIKQNGNNEITGSLLQQTLLAMVNSLGAGYQYVGIATPETSPGTPDQNVFYLASTAGTYVNFGGLNLADGEIAILKYNGAWSKDSTGAASLEKVNQLGQEIHFVQFPFSGGKPGYYIDDTGVEHVWQAGYISEYYPVLEGDLIKCYGAADSDALVIAFYNENMEFVADGKVAGTGSATLRLYSSVASYNGYVRCYTDNFRIPTAWADSYILLSSNILHEIDATRFVSKEQLADVEQEIKTDVVNMEVNLFDNSSAVPVPTRYFENPFSIGKKYYVKNLSAAPISFIAYDENKQELGYITHGVTLGVGAEEKFTFGYENAKFIGGYVADPEYSIAIGKADNEGELAVEIDALKKIVGTKLIIQNNVGNIYVPFIFAKGMQYAFTNKSNGICSLQYKTDEYSQPIEIKSPIAAGETYIFTPSDDAKYIGGYSSYGYNGVIESVVGLVSVVQQLGVKSTFSQTGAGTLFSSFSFEKGKQYKVRNNTRAILSVFLRKEIGGENTQAVADPLKPGDVVYFIAQDNANYIGGYSSAGYNISVSSVEGFVNQLNEMSPLPSIYESYLADKIAFIDRLHNVCGEGGDSFIFITDTHLIKNSLVCLPIIKYLSERLFVDKLIHGGDSGSITANYMPIYGWDAINKGMRLFYQYIANALKSGKFFGLVGNHDFNDRIYSGGSSEITGIDLKSRRNILLSLSPDNIVLGDSEDGAYYYYDNHVAKIRYIFLDTSFGQVAGAASIGGVQLQWFINLVLATPNGYELIVAGHIPFYENFSQYDIQYISFMGDVVNAINNKDQGVAVIGGVSYPYDFRNVDTRVIFNLFGHTHYDGELYNNGVLSIVTINNEYGNQPSYNMFEDTPLEKVPNTITEQAFDVFLITNDCIHSIRIGAGGDRHFHKSIVSPGNNMDMSELVEYITPTLWKSCDSASVRFNDTLATPEWEYQNTILSVNDDGIVTLNGGIGDAMIVAMDNELNKEIFLVHID